MPPEVAVVWAIDIDDLRQLERAGYAKFKFTLIFCPCVNVATDQDLTVGENHSFQLNWTANFSKKLLHDVYRKVVLRFAVALKKTFN